ncbi:MAG: lysophospholipid acyltransferase family protein [Patescibacteria group bacterium]
MSRAYPISRYFLYYPFLWRVNEVRGIDNLPKTGPFILAANHVSYWDPFFIVILIVKHLNRKIHFIANPRIWNWPGRKITAAYSGTIHLDLSDKGKVLEPALAVLKKNGIIGIFPEGHQHQGTSLGKARTGLARLALASRVPVIPVGCYGFETPSLWLKIKKLLRKKEPVEIYFGEPINLDQYYNQPVDKMLLDKISNQVMQAIAQLSNKSYPFVA